MDVKIITIHAMHNPGSVFQAFALQKYLSAEHEVKIIDYRPLYFYSEGSKLKLFIKKLLWGRTYRSRNKKFISFVERYMNLTARYETFDALNSAALTADVFLTGSDQLWNTDFPCGNDEAFYLSFAKCGKKISYSTSVGKKLIDENNLTILKRYLPSFKAISVREKSTSEQLKDAVGKDVAWVCDPVLLLPMSSYARFLSKENPIGKKYAVVYLLGASEKLNQVVAHYKSNGLYIVLAGGFTRRCECDRHIKDVGPEDFLNLIYHAEVVISSSFHATAFCHIFHKDFITFLPKTNGERIESLLQESSLENRSISAADDFDIDQIEQPINWSLVDNRLECYIKRSKDFLEKEL
ncbi:Polysaccharide pyruvyl transferase [Fibrobacter sp. UWH9]|uniref:polysaccharide pyruvyl transferase family protein n=1 Tax=Fibrobacter sp. UWH9 TaxID=1896213 RepID=UPI00091A96D4|nr:polysaccharide pyruvyl transferase family protein [Fibrobacter sp. UWH9]SHH27656.1 Polysaccharide pyruvyl transferase [Fibrobacter sp. UWH9]